MSMPALPPDGSQPWSRVLFPVDASRGRESYRSWAGTGRWWGWMTEDVAASLPGIARGLELIHGQVKQMPLDDYRGITPLPRPRLLEQPDPEEGRGWWVAVQVVDYLLNGNALHYVTTYDAEGWPATVAWLPSAWVDLVHVPGQRRPDLYVGGMRLEPDRVVHVKRRARRGEPWRGVGIVEQHLDALSTVRDQHRYESEVLQGAAVPSVAIISNNPKLSAEESDEGKAEFVETYGGPVREPVIFPAGTKVETLSWSPSDSQLVEARKLSLVDQANMLNLDGFWLGAESGSHTYKSPGPMYLHLLRQTVGPIVVDFEDIWSAKWLPRGRRVVFDRRAVLVDDTQTMVLTAKLAVEAGLWTVPEARVYLGMDPSVTPTRPVSTTSPVATVGVDANANGIPDDQEDDGNEDEDGDDGDELAEMVKAIVEILGRNRRSRRRKAS